MSATTNEDFLTLFEGQSIIIDSSAKFGKMTFLAYLLKFFYKEKAIIFSPQEKYLFEKRIGSLSKQFTQFEDLSDFLNIYFRKESWHGLKQKYGYEFLIEELERLMVAAEEKIFVIHKIGDFFEFQDRYQIENVYKALTKAASQYDKKIIFLANNKDDNFEYINNVANEFSDISVTISKNEKNERLINVKNILHNREYPTMNFRINNNNFIFDYNKETEAIIENKVKNILIVEIDHVNQNIKDLFAYIFNTHKFQLKYADSLQNILQEVFTRPDLIVISMKRNEENFRVINSIKKQLIDTPIIAILDQDFVRIEDIQYAYEHGCDELLPYNYSLENLLFSAQKMLKHTFYVDRVNQVDKYSNIIKTFEEFNMLMSDCIDKKIFFSAFVLEREDGFATINETTRRSDYIYQTHNKIYYLALTTLSHYIDKIMENYTKKDKSITVKCIVDPITHPNISSMEECT